MRCANCTSTCPTVCSAKEGVPGAEESADRTVLQGEVQVVDTSGLPTAGGSHSCDHHIPKIQCEHSYKADYQVVMNEVAASQLDDACTYIYSRIHSSLVLASLKVH